MLGINYFKAEPTEYARISANGETKKEGRGIAGFFLPHKTSIELIGTTVVDQPFVFQEVSVDNQELTLQGGFLYQVKEPEKTLARYNFAVDPKTKEYMTEDCTKVPEHVLQLIRSSARRIVQATSLEKLLVMSDEMSNAVGEDIAKADVIQELGLSVDALYFSSIQPKPDIAKALGAEYREGLLQKADKATYERRAMAVEQERAIRENQLKNDTELEEKRQKLVELEGTNKLSEAKFNSDAEKLEMGVFADMSADTIRAHALYKLGKDAARIENLTITPELLAGIRQAS